MVHRTLGDCVCTGSQPCRSIDEKPWCTRLLIGFAHAVFGDPEFFLKSWSVSMFSQKHRESYRATILKSPDLRWFPTVSSRLISTPEKSSCRDSPSHIKWTTPRERDRLVDLDNNKKFLLQIFSTPKQKK